MYFKALFNPSLEEDSVEQYDLDIDPKTGAEIIRFDNHIFELDRNEFGEISLLTYCNECINTFDIETVFITLLYNIIGNEQKVILVDSTGMEDQFDKDELLELIS